MTTYLVYSPNLCLPGRLFSLKTLAASPKQLIEDFKDYFAHIRPTPPSRHGDMSILTRPVLSGYISVFLQHDGGRER